MTEIQTEQSEGAIFTRLWAESGVLTPAVSKQILKISFSDADKKRISELGRKNSAGTITKKELAEYDNFIKVGDLLSLLQLRARRAIKNRNGHG